MEILFLNDNLRKICECPKTAVKKLGKNVANALKRRLADLDATPTLQHMPTGRPHPLSGDRAGQCAVALSGGARLVFSPAGEQTPMNEDGSVDWKSVSSIEIIFIGDYHD